MSFLWRVYGGLMEFKLDEDNYREHDSFNKSLIKKSLSDYGAGRSVLADADGVIIAGNGTYEQAKELGIPLEVVEIDGKELIAVKRTDIASNDGAFDELGIIDNSSSDSSKFNMDELRRKYDVPAMNWLGVPVFEASVVEAEDFFEEAPEKEKKKKKVVCACCGKEFEV